MATCEIKSFKIDGKIVRFNKEKNNTVFVNDDVEDINHYTVTDCILSKELLKPNEFTFTLRRNKIEKSEEFNKFTIVNNLIGKSVDCEVDTRLDGQPTSTLLFNGTIAKVSMKRLNITCVAYTDDIKLQGTPKSRYFSDVDLMGVITAVVPKGINVKSEFQRELVNLTYPYLVQYNESDYDFLVRLAKRFGAFYYIDYERGKPRLVIGKLQNASVRNLVDSPNVVSVSYELQSGNPNFHFIGHQYDLDVELDSISNPIKYDSLSPKKLFAKAVKSSTASDTQPKYRIDFPYNLPKSPNTDLVEKYSEMMMRSDAGRMGTCRFTSYLLDLQPGNIIKIDGNGLMVVTSAHLTWNLSGSPQNEITAMLLPGDSVDVETIFAPYMDFNAYPKSNAQRAVVVNNVDQQGMGRVQVQFIWQKKLSEAEQKKLPWIRIAQPYGGNEKGCYILPEIGEEVMVGFEHGNMEKPFVIGTLFHGACEKEKIQLPEKNWVETDQDNKKNEVKAFRTKKGHTIEFHDVDGDDKYGFIRIYGNEKKDKPNYDIILSTDKMVNSAAQDEPYSLKSADDQADTTKDIKIDKEYKADKLRLMVKSNGGDIMLDAGDGDIYLNAKNIHYSISGNRTTYIKEKDITSVGGDRFVDIVGSDSLLVRKKQDVLVKGDATAKYEGSVTITAKKEVKIDAQSLLLKTEKETKITAQSIHTKTEQNTEIVAQVFKSLAQKEINICGSEKATITSNNEAGIIGMNKLTLQGTQTTVIGMSKMTLNTPNGTRMGTWLDS